MLVESYIGKWLNFPKEEVGNEEMIVVSDYTAFLVICINVTSDCKLLSDI